MGWFIAPWISAWIRRTPFQRLETRFWAAVMLLVCLIIIMALLEPLWVLVPAP
jgi:hypothetical protein